MSRTSPFGSSATGLLFLAPLLAVPTAASATEDAAFKSATAAFEARKYDEALSHSDAALAVSREAPLRYLKARTVWELGRFEESWSLMNATRPNELPADQQEGFVTECARMEVEVKAKRKENAAEDVESASRKRQLKDATSAHNTSLWLFI